MKFELSPKLDRNKVFITNYSEIESRLDCSYYKPVFRKYYEKIAKIGDILKPVNHFSKVICGPFGSSITTQNYTSNGVPLIRISNIDTDGKLSDKDIIYISEKLADNLKAYKVYKNDIIVSQRGSLGLVSVVPEKLNGAVISANLITIKSLKSISPEFLQTVLLSTIGQKQIARRTSGQVQIKITTDDIKHLLIPLLDSSKQKEIVSKMKAAFTTKKQKETEAQRLLDSIDNYLFGELGIELPEQEEKTIQSRIFTRQLSEVSGGRFDPFFSSLNKQDKSGKYEFCKLKELAFIRKGDSITSNDVIDGNVPVIAGGQTSPYSHNISNCDGDVITVSASGAYSGFIWYHETPIFASDCSVIFSKNTDQLGNSFLFEYLKSEQQDIYNLQQGAGQPHVYPSDLEKIKIPVPPIEKQGEVVTYITSIRNQAKQLQQQAREELEQAKKETEAMIMGEL